MANIATFLVGFFRELLDLRAMSLRSLPVHSGPRFRWYALVALACSIASHSAMAQCLGTYSVGAPAALASCQSMIPAAETMYGDLGDWACSLGNPVSYFLYDNRTGQQGPWCTSFAFVPSEPKIVVIDPGHGFNCPPKMPLGAVGSTDFPVTNPPPGRLREDELTVAIALQVRAQLPPDKYKVILTKSSANACPTYRQRGRTANIANADLFVSLHVNAATLLPFVSGTSVIYNSNKPDSAILAEIFARSVSSSLGVNNRGAKVDDSLTVLTKGTTFMTAVLIEAARLSGSDEQILHASMAPSRIAAGVKAGIETYFGN